jgi:hypothetical protein
LEGCAVDHILNSVLLDHLLEMWISKEGFKARVVKQAQKYLV